MFRTYKKYSVRLAGIFALMILLSGCSWQSGLYVINLSKMPLVVRYSLSNGMSIPGSKAWHVENLSSDRLSLSDTVKIISRNEANGIRYVEIPAQSALLINESLNLDLRDTADCRRMLEELRSVETLSPNDASMQCNGVNCLPQLVKINRAQAAFVVK